MEKLKIGITHGYTNGVSYEVILKTFEEPTMLELCTPIVYGSPKLAIYHRKTLELSTNFTTIQHASEAIEGKLNIKECFTDEVKVELNSETSEAENATLRVFTLPSSSADKIVKALISAILRPLSWKDPSLLLDTKSIKESDK